MPNDHLAIECFDRKIRIWSWETAGFSDPLICYNSRSVVLNSSSKGILIASNFDRSDTSYETASRPESDDDSEYQRDLLFYDYLTGATQRLNVPFSFTTWHVIAAISNTNQLAICSSGRLVELHDLGIGTCSKLDSEVYPRKLYFSPDGQHLISSGDIKLTLWALKSGISLLIHRDVLMCDCVFFSPNGKDIAMLETWSIAIKDIQSEIRSEKRPKALVDFSPLSDRIMISIPKKGTVNVYNSFTKNLKSTVKDLPYLSRYFSKDGEWLACSGPYNVHVSSLNLDTQALLSLLNDEDSFIIGLTFSSDNKLLAAKTTSNSPTITVWNMDTQSLYRTIPCPSTAVIHLSDLDFSPDSNLLGALYSTDSHRNLVMIWDLERGKVISEGSDLPCASYIIAFSPDQAICALQSEDSSVLFWNWESGERRNTFGKHSTGIFHATFSKNGKLLASVSPEEILISEVDSGKQIQFIKNPFTGLRYLSFSDDDTRLVSDRGDVAVHANPTEWSNSLCNQQTYWRVSGGWIMEGDRRMIWLPPEFRRRNMKCHDGLVVMSNSSGELVYWELTKDRRLADII